MLLMDSIINFYKHAGDNGAENVGQPTSKSYLRYDEDKDLK